MRLHNINRAIVVEASNMMTAQHSELKPAIVTTTSKSFLQSSCYANSEILSSVIAKMNEAKPDLTKCLSSQVRNERELSLASDNQLDNHKAANNIASDDTKKSSLLTNGAASCFCEVAKPKPPPRLNKKKRNSSSENEQKTKIFDLNLGDSGDSVREESEGFPIEQHSDITEAKKEKNQFENTDGNYSAKSDSCGFFPEHANYLSILRVSDCSDTKQHKQSSQSQNPLKFKTSSNANSSGYLSQISGSVSLSPSNSNASSITSSKFPLASDGEMSRSSSITGKSCSMNSDNKINKVKHSKKDGAEVDINEDVFPVNSWLESSEYVSIAQKNTVEDDNKKDVSEKKSKAVETTIQKKESFNITEKKRPIINSISMVERRVDRPEERLRSTVFSGNVKLRMPGMRTKKNDASRNSRAFALQLKQLSEDSASFKTSQLDLTCSYDNDQPIRRQKSLFKTFLSSKSFQLDHSATLKILPDGSVTHNQDKLSEKLYNTISGATGRHLTEKSTLSCDSQKDEKTKKENPNISAIKKDYNNSTWSLSSYGSEIDSELRGQQPSIKDRLKGAFSFQNIRKAISMERLNEDTKNKSLSHSYLNECDQDISQISAHHRPTIVNNKAADSSSRLFKAPSVSSIFSTVRMRKRRSRERRAAKARHTIAIDTQNKEYDFSQYSVTNATENSSACSSSHIRPIGRILEMNVNEGSLLIEMVKTSSAPFGFYLARNKETGSVYISSMSDNYPNKLYAGLMKLGDEITEVNGKKVDRLTLDQVYDVISESKILLLRIKSQVHIV